MTQEINNPDIRCAVCQREYSTQFMKLQGIPFERCPGCGTIVPYLMTRHFIGLYMNWQEIRTLAIYAQRWAQTFDRSNPLNIEYLKALEVILEQLIKYKPADAEGLDPDVHIVNGKKEKLIRSPYYH